MERTGSCAPTLPRITATGPGGALLSGAHTRKTTVFLGSHRKLRNPSWAEREANKGLPKGQMEARVALVQPRGRVCSREKIEHFPQPIHNRNKGWVP